jgi:FkbM family methyltransferase
MRAPQFLRYVNLIRHIANWQDLLAVKLGRRPAWPLLFQTRRGIEVEVPRELMHDFKQIFMDVCYEVGDLPRPATVVDIGANTGFFSLFAAHRHPGARIIACEPIAENLLHLRRQIERNPAARIECLPIAIAGKTGQIEIGIEDDGVITTTASIAIEQAFHGKHVEVEALSLDDLFRRHGIDRCDLMKLDCEGAEYEILFSASTEVFARIERIAMEIHEIPGATADRSAAAMVRFLLDRGHHVARNNNIIRSWRRATN